jgi:hypothetical protein
MKLIWINPNPPDWVQYGVDGYGMGVKVWRIAHYGNVALIAKGQIGKLSVCR